MKNSDLGEREKKKKNSRRSPTREWESTHVWLEKRMETFTVLALRSCLKTTRLDHIARRSTEMLATFREMGPPSTGSPVDEPLLSRGKSRRNERDKDFCSSIESQPISRLLPRENSLAVIIQRHVRRVTFNNNSIEEY